MAIRPALALLVVAAICAACSSSTEGAASADDLGPGAQDAGGAAPPSGESAGRCWVDEDCEAVASSCCECPTFAAPVTDGIGALCEDVSCDPVPECPARQAVCSPAGECELACTPIPCDLSCAGGFAIDEAGCGVCACAAPETDALTCADDDDCTRVSADCCGCERGGADRAIAADEAAAFSEGLGCTGDEACPEVDVCDAERVPSCWFGRCALLPPSGDQDAGGPAIVCGSAANPTCPPGTTCVLNPADFPALATVGLGVCTGL